MKLNLKNFGLIIGLSAVMTFQSCVDLEPTVYSELAKDQFDATPEAFDGKLGDVYVNLQREYGYVYRQGYWAIQENTSDECFVPVRYLGDWFDDGFFETLHNHKFSSTTREVSQWGQGGENTWNFMYRGISKCNDMLGWMQNIEQNREKGPADDPGEMAKVADYNRNVAELRILRAWYHYLALDVWGNVPWVSSLDPTKDPVQITRPQLFDSIMTDLRFYVPKARTKKIYTRVNRYVGYMVLAKMYLNADAWGVIGKATTLDGMDAAACAAKAAEYCDLVIREGGYSLTSDYFENFKVDNEKSPENIWSVYYDANFSKGMQFHCMTLHYLSKETFGLTAKPWNGYCGHHKLIGLYEKKEDAPKTGWIPNDQFKDVRINCWARGDLDKDSAEFPIDLTVYGLMPKYVRKPYNYPSQSEMQKLGNYTGYFPTFYTDTITTMVNTPLSYQIFNIFEGPRFVKFEIQTGVGEHMSNDFPIFRLADTKLMLAEAICRAGGTVTYTTPSGQQVTLTMQDAQSAYEEVRKRSGLTTHPILQATDDNNSETMGELCNERCRELLWEGHRRQDLIRFDRFTGEKSKQNNNDKYNLWIFREEASANDKKIMPLPDFMIDNGFIQNPSYD